MPAVRRGSYSDDVGRRLRVATSRLAHLAAWTAYDVEDHEATDRYLGLALRLAKAAHDEAFEAVVPGVYICDGCVQLCNEVLAREGDRGAEGSCPGPPPGRGRRRQAADWLGSLFRSEATSPA